jgi:hypothetical protein
MSEFADDTVIREGLAACARGDLAALEQVLDPPVTCGGRFRPRDCENRDQVMALLRQRAAAGQRRHLVTRRSDE